ncbi:MAG: hypothetical protein WC483_00175 [Candidatus Paceibacterota bacterium]
MTTTCSRCRRRVATSPNGGVLASCTDGGVCVDCHVPLCKQDWTHPLLLPNLCFACSRDLLRCLSEEKCFRCERIMAFLVRDGQSICQACLFERWK